MPSSTKLDFLIRPYTSADEAAVVAVVNHSYRSPGARNNEALFISGPRLTAPELRTITHQMRLFVAEHHGRVVACIKTGISDASVVVKLDKPSGYIGMLAVHPDVQSRGLASMLIDHAETYCRANGADQMALDVLDLRVDLIKWYNRLGYITTSQSIDAAKVITDPDCAVLQPANFLLFIKHLTL